MDPMTYTGTHTAAAAEHRRERDRQWYRARKDARFAAEQYARAASYASHAAWLSRHPDLWTVDDTPATWEDNARSTAKLADTMLRASFGATEHARFYSALARRYDAMARRHDASVAAALADAPPAPDPFDAYLARKLDRPVAAVTAALDADDHDSQAATSHLLDARARGCEDCNAEPGEPCRSYCTGQAAQDDRAADLAAQTCEAHRGVVCTPSGHTYVCAACVAASTTEDRQAEVRAMIAARGWTEQVEHAAAAILAAALEQVIGFGDDCHCAGCGYFLTAGSPYYPDSDGRPLCVDCAAGGDAATCPRHGPTTVTGCGTTAGFAGGACYWAQLACGCFDMDESNDLAAAR